MIKDANFEVTQALHIREYFKSFFDYCHDEVRALELLQNRAQDSFRKCIKEIDKLASMFLNHARGIVNAFISGLNNAMVERLNGKIQEIKVTVRGYRRFENFRSAILFFHDDLDRFHEDGSRTKKNNTCKVLLQDYCLVPLIYRTQFVKSN